MVARSAGGREVAGSNPVTPIDNIPKNAGFPYYYKVSGIFLYHDCAYYLLLSLRLYAAIGL